MEKNVRIYARIPVNCSPAVHEFIKNQGNMSKTILRLFEDAVSRFGTEDLFHSTNSRLYSMEHTGSNSDEMKQLIYSMVNAFNTSTHVNKEYSHASLEEKKKIKAKNNIHDDNAEHSSNNQKKNPKQKELLLELEEDTFDDDIILFENQEPEPIQFLDINNEIETTSEIPLATTPKYDANIWDD